MAADLANATFLEADARDLRFDDGAFDVVVFDSTLTHGPERALAEAFRVVRPSGHLAGLRRRLRDDHDPLQACAAAMMANSVHDRWLGRRLPALARGCGFEVEARRRVEAGTFFGHIAYVSLVARKP